jgi:hypothetical protein
MFLNEVVRLQKVISFESKNQTQAGQLTAGEKSAGGTSQRLSKGEIIKSLSHITLLMIS